MGLHMGHHAVTLSVTGHKTRGGKSNANMGQPGVWGKITLRSEPERHVTSVESRSLGPRLRKTLQEYIAFILRC